MDTIVFEILKVQYTNPENGFSVLLGKRVDRKDNGIDALSIFVPVIEYVTAVGKIIDPSVGTTIRAKGEWVKTKYGVQFQMDDWEEEMPVTIEGIEGYLASGLIKGIGPIYAKKIVDTFKEDTFNVLDNYPDRLTEISGIGEKRRSEIIESWQKNRVVRNLTIFFKKYNISTGKIIKIYKRYGEDSISIIKDNPYRLADEIEGIGFKIADNIAINLGFALDSPKRIQSGIKFKMNELCEDGDTYEYYDYILEAAGEMLEVDDSVIEDNILEMTEKGWLVDCDGRIYLKYLYDAEVNVAKRLKELAEHEPQAPIRDVPISEIEEKIGVKYEEQQIEAIATAVKNNVMVLTGGPGTGKTTVTRGIIEMLTELGMSINLAAPTGKAAKRMSELTGRQAKTIHRLLSYNPSTGYLYCEANPLVEDVLIVDEASMINILLMDTLIRAVPNRMKLILIGDIDQLPAIGPGNVLKDIINSGEIPVVKLNKIFRQAQGSNIIINAHRVKDGEMVIIDNTKNSDFFFIGCEDDVNRNVVELVTKRLPAAYGCAPKDIQVLTPMKKCEVGVNRLNELLQEAINPTGDEIKRGNLIYRVGDKVMQTVNNYEKDVFNGDCGTVDRINVDEKIVYIRFDDRIVEYNYADLEEVSLAYAMTIHKSQGSEYPIVVIPITYANKIMMQRNLIYTAITRAKKICVIVGEKNMIRRAVANASSYKRLTMLKERLKEKPQD